MSNHIKIAPEELQKKWEESPHTKRKDLETYLLQNELRSLGKINNQHLIEALLAEDNLHEILSNPRVFESGLKQTLGSQNHTANSHVYKSQSFHYEEQIADIEKLTRTQFLRIHLLVKYLSQDVIDQIGHQIDTDILNPYSEHGGIVKFQPGPGLIFKEFESDLNKEKRRKNNTSYVLPYIALKIPHLFQYHYHATSKDDSRYAGPSQGNRQNLRNSDEGGDLLVAHLDAMKYGESHELVITKLDGPTFNIDYYGAIRRKKGSSITVLDIGNYTYNPSPHYKPKNILDTIIVLFNI